MRDNNIPTETVESLRALKRRVYLWALTFGLLAILTGWVFKSYAGTATPYDRAIFPILTALCLGLLVVLWRTSVGLVWVELFLFAGTALGLTGRSPPDEMCCLHLNNKTGRYVSSPVKTKSRPTK